MLSEIRAASILAAVSVAGYGWVQISASPVVQPVYALDNKFVRVSVSPPRKNQLMVIADCFSLTGQPLVRLYVPTNTIASLLEPPKGSSRNGVFATYIAPNEMFGCSGSDQGTVILIDLKSIPAESPFKDDAVKVDPEHNEMFLENDRVRVVRIHFPPGESGPMVDKRPRVIVAVGDSQATVTFPDGHSEPREMKAGTVSFGNAGRQATKNSGTTPLENIVVELKSK